MELVNWIKRGLGCHAGPEANPSIISLGGAGGSIFNTTLQGPWKEYKVRTPGRLYSVRSELTPDGVKGMRSGEKAQLSITLKFENKVIKFKPLMYVLFDDPHRAPNQETLEQFRSTRIKLSKPKSFAEGIRMLKQLVVDQKVMCYGRQGFSQEHPSTEEVLSQL